MALDLLADADALAARLPAQGRLLALDVGAKTIGLATSDPGRVVATPLETLKRGKFGRDAERLAATARDRGVCALVVGLPLHLGGESGRRAQSVRDFCRELAQRDTLFGDPAPPILLTDERLSTAAADSALRESGAGAAERGAKVDAHAAAWFLQALLDRLGRAG